MTIIPTKNDKFELNVSQGYCQWTSVMNEGQGMKIVHFGSSNTVSTKIQKKTKHCFNQDSERTTWWFGWVLCLATGGHRGCEVCKRFVYQSYWSYVTFTKIPEVFLSKDDMDIWGQLSDRTGIVSCLHCGREHLLPTHLGKGSCEWLPTSVYSTWGYASPESKQSAIKVWRLTPLVAWHVFDIILHVHSSLHWRLLLCQVFPW